MAQGHRGLTPSLPGCRRTRVCLIRLSTFSPPPPARPTRTPAPPFLKPQIKAFLTWLQEQEDAQAKKLPHEDPAFESSLVTIKWEILGKAFDRLNNKRKPKPPKAPAADKGNATAGEGNATGAGEGAEGGAEGEGGEKQQGEGAGEGEQQQQQQGAGGAGAAAGEGEAEEELPAHEEL